MFKRLIVFFIILSIGGYLYSRKNDSSENENSAEEDDVAQDESKNHNSKNILAEKDLHKAFEKILENKEQINKRDLASGSVNLEDFAPVDENSRTSPGNHLEEDYESEFDEMNPSEKEMTIRNLHFEIQHEQKLLEQMDNDQRQGLNVTEDDISAINQRIEINKNKFEIFNSRMNAQGE